MPTKSPLQSSVRAVLFDLDDTIFDHQHARRSALVVLQRVYGATFANRSLLELEAAHERHLQTTFALLAARKLGLEESRRERMRLLFADYDLMISPEAAAEAESNYRLAYDAARRPVPGVVALISALRRRGLKLAVVTNGLGIEQHEKLRLCGLADAFDAVVLAGDLGLRKPDPAIFNRALEVLDSTAAHAVVVGDSWKLDVVGARNAGLRSIWFNRYDEAYPESGDEAFDSVLTVKRLEPLEDILRLLLG